MYRLSTLAADAIEAVVRIAVERIRERDVFFKCIFVFTN